MRIDRNANNFGIQLFKFTDSITETNDFSWTNKGKVQRVEEQN